MSNQGLKMWRGMLMVIFFCILLITNVLTIYGTYYDYYVTSMPYPPEQHAMVIYMTLSIAITLMYIFIVLRKYQFVPKSEAKKQVNTHV